MNFEYEKLSDDRLLRTRWRFTFHLIYGKAMVQCHARIEETRESTRKRTWTRVRYWIPPHLRNEFGPGERMPCLPTIPYDIEMKLRDDVEKRIVYDFPSDA
jgi:hypothetical protein